MIGSYLRWHDHEHRMPVKMRVTRCDLIDIVFTYTLQRTNQKVIFLEYLYFLSIYIHIHARSYNDPNHYIMLYPLDPQLPLHATKVKILVKFHSLEVSIFYVQECYG